MIKNLVHIAATTALTLVIFAGISFLANRASAASEIELMNRAWPHEGIFGSYDKEAARRGLNIYLENCSGCHSLDYVTYRTLADIGLSEDEVKEIAANAYFMDALDEYGEPMERSGITADFFQAPFANEVAARASNNGSLPPDLSLITKARMDGSNYVYSLLNGYLDFDDYPTGAPEGFDLMDDMTYNTYFTDHQIAMAAPLYPVGCDDYEDDADYKACGVKSVEAQAADVVEFLSWAAEPHLEARKTLGAKVMMFLLLFGVLAYFTNRRVWKDVK